MMVLFYNNLSRGKKLSESNLNKIFMSSSQKYYKMKISMNFSKDVSFRDPHTNQWIGGNKWIQLMGNVNHVPANLLMAGFFFSGSMRL